MNCNGFAFSFRHGEMGKINFILVRRYVDRYTWGRLSTYLRYDIMNSSLCVCNSGGICTKWLEVAVFVRVLPWWILVSTFFETVHLGMKPYVEKIHAFSKVQSPVQFVLIPTNFESMFCTIAMR